jgi:hypothetical protein
VQKSTHDYQRLQTLNGIQEHEQPGAPSAVNRGWLGCVSAAESDLSRVKNEETDDPEAETES